jgi:hypothetical protein
VTLAQMTNEKMQEITAPTPYEALTIITCGGEFDYNAGEYLQRDIVRARLVEGQEQGTRVNEEAEPAPEVTATEAAAEDGAESAVATVTQNGVNVRPAASTGQDAIGVANSGDTVTITGEPVEAEGMRWYPVELADGTAGFIVADFLEIAP